mgnify:CR=1 FL=1
MTEYYSATHSRPLVQTIVSISENLLTTNVIYNHLQDLNNFFEFYQKVVLIFDSDNADSIYSEIFHFLSLHSKINLIMQF